MGWLTGWFNRKKINLTGQSGAGTGYQVKLLVGESSGAAGVNFHVGGNATAFPSGENTSGDLRFTDNGGETLLDFYVESVSGTTPNRIATIWVEVAADLGSNQGIYCYYNSVTTTNVSNGDNTFLFFDDASGTIGNKWSDITGTAVYASIGGKQSISLDDATTLVRTKTYTHPLSSGFAIEWWSYCTAILNELHYFQDTTPSGTERYRARMDVRTDASNHYNHIYKEASPIVTSSHQGGASTWRKCRLKYSESRNHSWEVNGVNEGNANDSTYTSDGYIALGHLNSGSGAVAQLFVRKYVATEPSFSTAESEEYTSTPEKIIILTVCDSVSNSSNLMFLVF